MLKRLFFFNEFQAICLHVIEAFLHREQIMIYRSFASTLIEEIVN